MIMVFDKNEWQKAIHTCPVESFWLLRKERRNVHKYIFGLTEIIWLPMKANTKAKLYLFRRQNMVANEDTPKAIHV